MVKTRLDETHSGDCVDKGFRRTETLFMTKVVLGKTSRFSTGLATTPAAVSADDGFGVVTIAAVVGDDAIRAVEI